MAWVAVEENGDEYVFGNKPSRGLSFGRRTERGSWENILCDGFDDIYFDIVLLPKGSIEKLIGKQMTWNDEPVKLK